MKERLVLLLKAEGLTNSQFASKLDIQRSNITHIIEGRSKPGFVFMEKLAAEFPNVNIRWFITGQGEMYVTNDKEMKIATVPVQNSNVSPTLFSDTDTNQNINNQPVQIPEQTKDSNTPTSPKAKKTAQKPAPKQKPELKLEPVSENVPQNVGQSSIPSNTSSSMQSNIHEPDPIKNKEQEIECVLIFHSDKTFKYYRPV
jgi:transcriptional regulator with XRE-family HTH domain